MKRLLILVGALTLPGISHAQSSCAYGVRDCSDLRNITRPVREDLTNRTPIVPIATRDVTVRVREDLTNRTRQLAIAPLDITDRRNREDLSNRTRVIALSPLDITDRRNREDLRDRTLACP